MKTSVIGYPRIGSLRELKFASEEYFRKEIGAEELLQTAAELRKQHWNSQKKAGIDFISSNDFSFYDMVLDTAVLLGIVPKRYQELKLSGLDTYFALARGYQGESGDVKALAMKKWFNTNYHYIVPELEDDTEISLSGTKPWDEYEEAKALGIETKPVIIGAYTILKLTRYTGKKPAGDFVDDIVKVYQDIVKKCEKDQIAWVQFDEPALVQDMSLEDITLFHRIYDKILADKGSCKILLQTYFGDVRDVYQELIRMPFDGIGLDFLEGKETGHLIGRYGFPQEKVLFAGLVNGKNIWKNHYEKTLKILEKLQEKDLLVESEGAHIVPLDDYDMAPCLILKNDGSSIYATRDIAAIFYRKETYNFVKCLYVTGQEQKLHFKQVFKVVELLGNEWAKDQLVHIPYGLVSLEGAKLSTRSGNIIYAEDILLEAIAKIKEIINEKNPDLPDKDETAKKIGVGAVLFNDLYNQRIKDVSFKWEKLLNFDGETGPYVQYTHARCCSILKKLDGFTPSADIDYSVLTDVEAMELLKEINRFPKVVKDASERYEPSAVARFAVDVAQAFNKFYNACRIHVEEENVRNARATLVYITKKTIKDAMELLGIDCPEQM